jgi:N-acetylglutamate synthase-like GNAT family acetyltransferase
MVEEMKILDLKQVPHHLETLARWHQEEWGYFKPDKTLAERIKRMKSHLLPEFIPTTFIAENHELFGSASIIEHDMDTRKELTPWLAGVYVKSEFRRQGIGSTLVLYVMEQARKNKIERLYLFTPDMDAFYARLGWKIFEKTRYYGYLVTIMHVDL